MAQAFYSGAFESTAFEVGAVAYTLDASPASYSISGAAATTTVARSVVASPTSYALTGQPATTAVERLLSADAGVSTLTGSQALLAASRALAGDPGTYNITGVDATLTYVAATLWQVSWAEMEVPAGSISAVLNAESGSFTLTGANATLAATKIFSADTGTYVITGSAATVSKGSALVASPANYTSAEYVDPGYVDPGYVGNDNPPAALLATRYLNLASGSFSVTGAAATLERSRQLKAEFGIYNLTGFDARLQYPYWPLPSQVVLGVVYGPNGDDYIGTYADLGLKIDINTGALIKPLSSKTAITL